MLTRSMTRKKTTKRDDAKTSTMNARLPASIVYCLLLEWLSPEEVWAAVRASGVLRRHALEMAASAIPGAVFHAAEGQVLSDACVRWFRERMPPSSLVLWTTVDTTSWINAVVYKCNGQEHRDGDLPAVVYADGVQEWYQHGKLHRDRDKPAFIDADGEQHWYWNDKLHRDRDLPAMVFADGSREWYKNGELHRDRDKPAVVDANGDQAWYKNGKLHRDGDKPAKVFAGGRREWYKNGKLHRDCDQPAIEGTFGYKSWYQHGKPHRGGDKPAVSSKNIMMWYKNGQLHRGGDKPAILYATGGEERWMHGQRCSEK